MATFIMDRDEEPGQRKRIRRKPAFRQHFDRHRRSQPALARLRAGRKEGA